MQNLVVAKIYGRGIIIMALDLFELVTSLDKNEDIHLARILILLEAFSREDQAAMKGITKLAKLDFLLRYPSYFETAMIARGASTKNYEIEPFEHDTIEASMVRYRFGPWDHRYRRFLNVLAAKALVTISVQGRTILIDLTNRGRQVAQSLSESDEFVSIQNRASMLRKHLDIGATRLMEFIYEQFPELHNMEFNETISSETLVQ